MSSAAAEAPDWLVLQLTGHSGTDVGIVTALQFLPQSLLGLWGGVIADRYPQRTLLLDTQSLMAGQALLLGMLTLGGTVRVWHVYPWPWPSVWPPRWTGRRATPSSASWSAAHGCPARSA